jgi:arsenite oxidase small subunit
LTDHTYAQGSPLPDDGSDDKKEKGFSLSVSRRQFLFMGAVAVSLVALERVIPGRILYAQAADFDRQRIGSLSDLEVGFPVAFNYPYDHPNALNNLIKLGTPAHMGFPLSGTYKPDHQVMGPCGWHLSTYDLTHHGIIISGHATQGLPQITLELDGDDIYATGVQALLFGFADNDDASV